MLKISILVERSADNESVVGCVTTVNLIGGFVPKQEEFVGSRNFNEQYAEAPTNLWHSYVWSPGKFKNSFDLVCKGGNKTEQLWVPKVLAFREWG